MLDQNIHGSEKVEMHLISLLTVLFFLEWSNSEQWISWKRWFWRLISSCLLSYLFFSCAYQHIYLQAIASNLNEEEIKGLKQMFMNKDTDNSGTITYEELKAGLPKLGLNLSEAEVKQLMEAVCSNLELCYSTFLGSCSWLTCLPFDLFQADVDGNGSIDYVEFITATMHRHKLERDEHLFKAFQYFDKDNSGWVLQLTSQRQSNNFFVHKNLSKLSVILLSLVYIY